MDDDDCDYGDAWSGAKPADPEWQRFERRAVRYIALAGAIVWTAWLVWG